MEKNKYFEEVNCLNIQFTCVDPNFYSAVVQAPLAAFLKVYVELLICFLA